MLAKVTLAAMTALATVSPTKPNRPQECRAKNAFENVNGHAIYQTYYMNDGAAAEVCQDPWCPMICPFPTNRTKPMVKILDARLAK